MATSQEKKDYILVNIDKYIVDGRGNFYWEDAEEGMEYIYRGELETLDEVEIIINISKRFFETKEDWGLEFIEDDIHSWSILLYKNKKDGRLMNAQRVWDIFGETRAGKLINDYKGTDKKKLICLEINGIINEEQQKNLDKYYQETEQKHQESEQFIRDTDEWLKERVKNEEKWQKEKAAWEEQQKVWEKQENQTTTLIESKRFQSIPSYSSPVINNAVIENSDKIAEALQQTTRQIYQLLASKQLKTSELPPEYQSWKEQLKNLTTNEELSAYTQRLEQALSKQQQPVSEKNNGLSLSVKIGIGLGLGLVIAGIVFFVLKRRVNSNLKKRNMTA